MNKTYAILVSVATLLLIAWGVGALGALASPFEDQYPTFGHDLATSFLGAAVGVFLALELERYGTKREAAEQRTRVLIRTVEAFERNEWLVYRVISELLCGIYNRPTFRCDLASLESLSAPRAEFLVGSELLSKIDEAIYELKHVNNRLELMYLANPSLFVGKAVSALSSDELAELCKECDRRACSQCLASRMAVLTKHSPVHPKLVELVFHKIGILILADGAYDKCVGAIVALNDEINRSQRANVWEWLAWCLPPFSPRKSKFHEPYWKNGMCPPREECGCAA